MENMELYNSFRAVPESAQKKIQAGRIKGMTDINPMWRIQALTERFGPCGIGWKYVITNKQTLEGANNEIAAFVDIDLYYKLNGEWSEAIPGTGGASFVAKETRGMYTSDECYKMALTDAISVACKALGIGADVYWGAGRSKYNNTPIGDNASPPTICAECGKPIKGAQDANGVQHTAPEMAAYTAQQYGRPLCLACMNAANNG